MNLKKFAVICAIGVGLLSPTFIKPTTINNLSITTIESPTYSDYFSHKNHVTTLNASQNNSVNFSISDSNLASAMMTLFGKSENKFNSNDLINHVDYKVQKEQTGTTTDPETSEEIPVYREFANKTCLDLSNRNITDISELSQFVWPKTLTSIDLSFNKIDNSNIEKLVTFSGLTPTTGEVEEGEPLIYSDIANIVKIINLNFNKLDLFEFNLSFLNNEKFLFGFQNYSNGIFNKDHPTAYYFRSGDLQYFNTSATLNNSPINLIIDAQTKLSYHGFGDYIINISNVENSNIANFSKQLKTSLFNIYVVDTFWVERKSLFGITKNDIVIEGLTEGYEISSQNSSTYNVGISYVNVTISTNTKNWTITLPYNVRDTIIPTIELIGPEEIYLKLNGNKYVEYRAKGYDSGDDISERIQISGSVDISTAGEYTITYTLTDHAGKEAIPVTRKVIVQEYSIEKIILSTIEDEYRVGENITITANLPIGTNLSKYSRLQYKWYYNGVEFISNTGDLLTGIGSTTINELDTKDIEIFAVLVATLKDGTTETYVSNTININIKSKVNNTPTIIISLIIALVLIIVSCLSVTIYKKKKATHEKDKKHSSKGNTKNKSTKSKNGKNNKGKSSNYDNIQVIRNYNNNDDTPPSSMQL